MPTGLASAAAVLITPLPGQPTDRAAAQPTGDPVPIPIEDPVSYQPLLTLVLAAAGILLVAVVIAAIWVRRRRAGRR